MKNLILSLLFFLPSSLLVAQNNFFSQSELESTFGVINTGSKFGIFGGLEGRYNYSNQLSIGLKYDSFFLLDEEEFNENKFNFEESYGIKAISLTGDYYFGKARNSFFIGMEVGLFTANFVQDDRESNVDLGTKFGLTPRIGAELGWFRPAIKYNFIPKFGQEDLSSLALSLGFTIGEKRNK